MTVKECILSNIPPTGLDLRWLELVVTIAEWERLHPERSDLALSLAIIFGYPV